MNHDDEVSGGRAGAATLEGPAARGCVLPLERLPGRTLPGDADVRGWEVIASDGRAVGRVNDLLVETAGMRVRYLDVRLDPYLLAGTMTGLLPESGDLPVDAVEKGEGAAGEEDLRDRHVLLSIGHVRLERGAAQVFLDTLRTGELLELPAYDPRALDRAIEPATRRRLAEEVADESPFEEEVGQG